jgi:adenylosuccinate synthase
LLDIDFGSYPYVTSSNPTSGGAMTGTGLPPTAIDEIIGVIKAYTTRVGGGPFPTEVISDSGKLLQEKGHEFGATTGRPRRCGWFDAVAAQYAIRLNGLTSLALTKLDVLDSFGEIKFCTKYRYGGNYLHHFPADLKILEECEPVLETIKGWQEPIGHCKKFEELPQNAQEYVKVIEKICNVKVAYISVGVEREQIILR